MNKVINKIKQEIGEADPGPKNKRGNLNRMINIDHIIMKTRDNLKSMKEADLLRIKKKILIIMKVIIQRLIIYNKILI